VDLQVDTNLSEEHFFSALKMEALCSTETLPSSPHGVTTQKNNIDDVRFVQHHIRAEEQAAIHLHAMSIFKMRGVPSPSTLSVSVHGIELRT
jgi:hypothetical protein